MIVYCEPPCGTKLLIGAATSAPVRPTGFANDTCCHPLPLSHVAARIDNEPVQPRRELRLAPELPQADAELRERLLRSVARILRIAEEASREPLDTRRMAGA